LPFDEEHGAFGVNSGGLNPIQARSGWQRKIAEKMLATERARHTIVEDVQTVPSTRVRAPWGWPTRISARRVIAYGRLRANLAGNGLIFDRLSLSSFESTHYRRVRSLEGGCGAAHFGALSLLAHVTV
jgi:hypothetical protein